MKDHAAEASLVIDEVESDAYDGGKDAEGLTFDQRIAIAQVHATLAVAAALNAKADR